MKLREMRDKRGISRAQLSDASGVSTRTIEAYEQGLRDIGEASVNTVHKLAKALYCKIEDIVDFE